MTRSERWTRLRTPLAVYVIAAGVYVAMLGHRIEGPTSDNHFVHLAQSFLAGQLGVIGNHPPGMNDWACYDSATNEVCPMSSFTTTGPTQHWFVSFPPLPALVILPLVAIWGTAVRDALFWALLAGLSPALLYVLLRELCERGVSTRSPRENLTLTALYAFGTVFFFTAVQGTVWFAAHVVACALLPLYLMCALEARRPALAGLLLGCMFMTRPPMGLLLGIVFVVELLRVHRREGAPEIPSADDAGIARRLRAFLAGVAWRDVLRKLVPLAIPILVIGGIAMWMNEARWGRPLEFGHRYLVIYWQARIARWGMFNYHYLSKNLAVFLASLPWLTIRSDPPLIISRHGLALWVTTPALLLVFFPKRRVDAHMVGLYLAAGAICVLDLMYQNTGWVQFGYRFSLDYMMLLFVLLALGGRPFRGGFHLAMLFAIAINTFGAITFDRAGQFYDGDGSQDRVFQPD
jgi:hypothetical protein